ncbi:MAG: 2-C-methyl-D-erythritol 2,4-cyclodiphosphate synthase [Firmicutes bacterium]|jgi:2-C-methyl-D-erythritol 2,4-cyclodiphosphate synthase|nr:2-C-methyl-D-erythritol 2,4-cyclodiphosphate synthase [Bacillota bacterium]
MFRIGIGYDIHRLVGGRDLVLGGVKVPFSLGLDGHSDADVLVHAIIDAMLGALSLPDIGILFPDDEERYRGISSVRLLEKVAGIASAKGFRPINIDSVIMAEKPKLASYLPEIKAELARALKIDKDSIGIKATTMEGLGAIGNSEAIAVQAVVLLCKDRQGTS